MKPGCMKIGLGMSYANYVRHCKIIWQSGAPVAVKDWSDYRYKKGIILLSYHESKVRRMSMYSA
jgi:hypothetical protein